MPDREPKLAVLIDADNAPAADAAALFVEIAKLGEASLRRAYGDFSRLTRKGWNMTTLARHAIQPHQEFPHTRGKNATDIAMVIDAMDLLHSGRFDGFCLVTSDSDFTRLAARIREQGLAVFGIGRQRTPESFRQACTRFIYTENFAADAEAAPAAAPSPAAGAEPETAPAPVRLPPSEIVPQLRLAVDELEGEAGGWVPLGRVGQILNNRHPDFDPRSYGYTKLSDLVDSTGQFEIDRSAQHLRVRPKRGVR